MRLPWVGVWIVIFAGWVVACNEETEHVDPVTASLVETLNDELRPLSSDPLQWTDAEMQFLDGISYNEIVGVGEATHGTSEFFKAKHRIFRYMVEHHGFKIFAIEADFGESVFINQAVLNSDKSQLEALMMEKMQFWTWRTTEVLNLLTWMCDYNVGKPEEEKVQYWGVDCQLNTFHPDLLKAQLDAVNVPIYSFAEMIWEEASIASKNKFSTYTTDQFDAYLGKVDALNDSLAKYQTMIVDQSSVKQFQLTVQLVEVIRQVSEVIYYTAKRSSKNYRDEYMAKNAEWLHNYFGGKKIVLWAHNFHVSDNEAAGSMGHHLKDNFPNKYGTIGFLFSKGTFTAVSRSITQLLGVRTQTLDNDPKLGSINDVMFRANADDFAVSLSDLQDHSEWQQAFQDGIEYFQIGTIYDKSTNYYELFDPGYFDRLIYIENSQASTILK